LTPLARAPIVPGQPMGDSPMAIDENSAAQMSAAIEEIARGTDRLAVIIMPRNTGPGPQRPHGHSVLFSRADIVAEWENGEFHIIKQKERA
jgi:hypothetical protein